MKTVIAQASYVVSQRVNMVCQPVTAAETAATATAAAAAATAAEACHLQSQLQVSRVLTQLTTARVLCADSCCSAEEHSCIAEAVGMHNDCCVYLPRDSLKPKEESVSSRR